MQKSQTLKHVNIIAKNMQEAREKFQCSDLFRYAKIKKIKTKNWNYGKDFKQFEVFFYDRKAPQNISKLSGK